MRAVLAAALFATAVLAAALLSTAALAGCGDAGISPADGMALEASVLPDGGPPLDGVAPPFADFTAIGCAYDAATDTCRGTAPLAVTFVPIVGSSVETYEWTFGDGGATSSQPAPTYVYERPDAYDVTLNVGGPAGGAAVTRPGFIVVDPVPTGSPCTLDAQCRWGTCLCADAGAPCDVPLDTGLCTLACEEASCGEDEACADLALAGGTEPWRGRLCLAACETDADCARPGFACRDLPAGEAEGGWVRACFPPLLLAAPGEPCAAPSGEPDATRCAGGACLPVGALGLCSADCSARPCPGGTSCALVGPDALALCFAACDGFSCDADPLLACEAPLMAGDWGFSTFEGDETTYCAARRCESAAECAPYGACDEASGGFCALP